MLQRFTVQVGRAIRETGQAIDRSALRMLDSNVFEEKFSRHRQVMGLNGKRPQIAHDVWVAPNATVVGDVILSNNCSIWYGCVLRGDLNSIQVGLNTNIQDRCIIHTTSRITPGIATGTKIGKDVTVGHGCTLYSCTIESNVLIGMGSIILDGALIEGECIVAAGSVVPPGRRIPKGQLWAGNPAKFVRDLSDDEKKQLPEMATHYCGIARSHSDEFLPYGTHYLDAERLKQEQQE